MTEDYSQYATTDTDTDLGKVQELAEKQAAAEAEVKRCEAELNKAQERLRNISEKELPELMEQFGLSEFKTMSGLTIKVEEKIRASIPKAKSIEAFEWLRAHGSAALIKRIVSISFGKGEDEKAQELLEELSREFEVDEKVSVHPSTLASYVKEKLQAGEDLPLELFGVHRQRVTKIGL